MSFFEGILCTDLLYLVLLSVHFHFLNERIVYGGGNFYQVGKINLCRCRILQSVY